MCLKNFFRLLFASLLLGLFTSPLSAQPTECFDFNNLDIGQKIGIEVALTRQDGLIKNGAGVIGNFIVIIDEIEGYSGEGSVEIQNVQVIDNEGNLLTIHTPMMQFSTITETIELETTNSINVYPNPAKEHLSIQHDLKEALLSVEISTISGQLIQRVLPNQVNPIDISGLMDGVYLIKINTDEKSIYRKFVKQ